MLVRQFVQTANSTKSHGQHEDELVSHALRLDFENCNEMKMEQRCF